MRNVRRPAICLGIAAAIVALAYSESAAVPPAPLPPREAAAAMKVPDGFKVTLFAGEPDVAQPIAMCFDDRGRLWVAECHTYPNWIKDGKPGNDRIVIFEDTDNDGVFDKRTVFLDKLANLTSIEFGFGGLYALTAPQLIHIPIDKTGDRPAGEPKILLDGWTLEAKHNIVNGLKWGPDGWLYGCHGILATSHVGKPGTPKAERPPINCGVWRFHPVTHKYEIVCHGGTNPWGLDWDEQGELYFTNCVIDHAFHVIPGGHYQRMYGNDFNPHLYKLMGSCVDHLHWGGGHWTDSRSNGDKGGASKHSEAGGGHAHSGCMIYLGDNFPKEYRNTLFTGNIHGNRINRDRIDYGKYGPVLKHEKDFLFGNDPWFRPIAMNYGPDGGVYIIDWTDTGECHNYDKVHRTSGRIYKVVYGKTEPLSIDLPKLESKKLAALHASTNQWVVRHSRRIIQEQMHNAKERDSDWTFHLMLRELRPSQIAFLVDLSKQADSTMLECAQTSRMLTREAQSRGLALRSLSTNQLGNYKQLEVQDHLDMHAASTDDSTVSIIAGYLKRSKGRDVPLKIASNLHRLPNELRWQLAELLLSGSDDQFDPDIPLLIWYAIEDLPTIDLSRSLDTLKHARIPLIREFLARRIASLPASKNSPAVIAKLTALAKTHADEEIARDILNGMAAAFKGRRDVPMPEDWEDASLIFRHSPLYDVRDRAAALGVVFGETASIEWVTNLTKNPQADLPRRRDALKTLLAKQPDTLRPLLGELLDDADLRSAAIKGLAAFSDDKIPPRLLAIYPKLSAAERSDALATLSSRPVFALALLDAVAAKTIARKELGPVEVRQLLALKDAKVTARVEEVWGTVRPAAKDNAALMAKYKKLLAADQIKTADHAVGRQMFVKHCAACHKLFGEGGAIGPDITGSQRANLDYLLENILDPSAVVPREYQVTIFVTKAGRTIAGLVKEENDASVSVQTQNEIVVLPKADIEQRTASKQSMMPDGILEQMAIEEARALVAYLGRTTPLEKRSPP